jgi:hypothetical protein
VLRGNPNFLILSYSFSISRLYRIPQNISPFLVPIIVVSIVYSVYAVHRKGVRINNNHFKYWSSNYLGYIMSYTSTCPITYFTPKNVTIKFWSGGRVLNFSLDEGGGVLKIKVLRSGGGYKKFNIWYLSPIAPPPPPVPTHPPIINDRSLTTKLI